MGIMKAPNYEFYWAKDPIFRYPGIADAMTKDRFILLQKFVYYVDPQSDPRNTEDPILKFRRLYDAVSEKCSNYWTHNTNTLTIDESMVAFSGRHSGRVYMPRKPIRNGFKIYMLSDSQGYVLRLIPSFCFKGKDHTVEKVVLSLLEGYEDQNFHVFMDR